MSLIIPKNNADPETLYLALEVYVESGDWVENSSLIASLSKKLQSAGKEDELKEPQSYTKKTQVLSYYGFIEWEDAANVQSRRRVTPSGLEFYDALKTNDQKRIDKILIDSLLTRTFGRNVLGCNSNSDVEAPNVFIKASILLNGITNQEFAYIAYNMDANHEDFSSLIAELKVKRSLGMGIQLAEGARKYADPKPITALKGWHVLTTNTDNSEKKIVVRRDLLEKEWKVLCSLRTKNTEQQFLPQLKLCEEMANIDDTQIIYYGAPGTGKSHTIKVKTKGKDVIRTTFHPDSDYSTFVGAYKPTMDTNERFDDSGKLVRYLEDVKNHKKGEPIEEKEIVYRFVEQAFLQAYIAAWQKYCTNQNESIAQYLIIEEINRGNCAQIFGDLFQLLDRNEYGFSEYPINADSDICNHIRDKFAELQLSIADHEIINRMYVDDNDNSADIAQKVLDGEILLLPKNLFIWATMNTSDQSLFPIDSAFKRRWTWKYVPITEALMYDDSGNVIKDSDGKPKHKDWVIKVGNVKYNWWSFLENVNNDVIYSLTSSEDKKLGYFFCKAKNGIISAETFTDKVVFYLWNEIFRDAPTDDLKCLQNKEDKDCPRLTFQSFYTKDEDGKTVVNEKTLNTFLTNLGVKGNSDDETKEGVTEKESEQSENNVK